MTSWRRAQAGLVCLAFLILVLLFGFPAERQSARTRPQTSRGYGDLIETDLEEASVQQGSKLSQSAKPACAVIKVSMLYGAHESSQMEVAQDFHRRHSKRWGCGFENLKYDLTSRKLYSKHYFLLSTMLRELSKPEPQRRQWLMWVDADSIAINPALSPEIFLPPEDLKDVYALLTADHNGLNAGVFYLKVHHLSVDFLTRIVAYPLAYPDEDLGWFGEQAAMTRVLNSSDGPSASGVAWLPRTWFNAYQFESGFEGEPGNMLVHFAGLAETRLSQMANWLEELQQNQAKWEIPLDKTFYRKAIPDFWSKFRRNYAGET